MREKHIVGSVHTTSTCTAYLSTIIGSSGIQLLGMASGILSARLLGPEDRGLFVLVALVPSLTVSLGNLSLPFATAYIGTTRPEMVRYLTSTTFWLSLLLSLGLVLIASLCLFYVVPSNKQVALSTLTWYVWTIPFTFVLMSLLGVDHGLGRFVRYNVFRILPPIFYVLGMGGMWLLGRTSLGGIALCNLAGTTVTAAVRSLMAWRSLRPQFFSFRLALTLLKQGTVLHMPMLTSMLLMNIDSILLLHMLDAVFLGYYAAALAVAMGQYGLASAIMQVSFVTIARDSANETAVIRLARHVRYAQVVLLPVSVGIALTAHWLIPAFFGKLFAPAIPIAVPLVFAKGLYGLSVVFDTALRALGHSAVSAAANMLAVAIVVVTAPLLVDRFGAAGMAIGMCVAMVSMLTFLCGYCCLIYHVPWVEFWGFRPQVLRELGMHFSCSMHAQLCAHGRSARVGVLDQ